MTTLPEPSPESAPDRPLPGDEQDIDVVVVTLRFDAADEAALLAILSRYIVLTRMEHGCRNVDLVSSVTTPGRHLVIQKWDGFAEQQAHFDSAMMAEMAEACTGLLAGPPDIDLWSATSAHDLA
ncbi:MAG: antibiotic biosynthesis monooxygenase [Actinomycetota bacterium]